MWRRSRFPASAQTDVRSSRVDERTRAKVRSSFGFQTSPREREEPEAASHSIAVEFIVWNPPDRLIHTSCIGVKVRSLVSQPCYTYWERHPRASHSKEMFCRVPTSTRFDQILTIFVPIFNENLMTATHQNKIHDASRGFRRHRRQWRPLASDFCRQVLLSRRGPKYPLGLHHDRVREVHGAEMRGRACSRAEARGCRVR